MNRALEISAPAVVPLSSEAAQYDSIDDAARGVLVGVVIGAVVWIAVLLPALL